jgi:addiction module HigA family antidote
MGRRPQEEDTLREKTIAGGAIGKAARAKPGRGGRSTVFRDASGAWRISIAGNAVTDTFPSRDAAMERMRAMARGRKNPRIKLAADAGRDHHLTDEEIAALPKGAILPPVHPGEVLLEEFIRPYGLSPIRLAAQLGVPRTRIERLVAGDTSMTEDTALRLERLFGASAEFWLGLQASHDLAVARRRDDSTIAAIAPIAAPAV